MQLIGVARIKFFPNLGHRIETAVSEQTDANKGWQPVCVMSQKYNRRQCRFLVGRFFPCLQGASGFGDYEAQQCIIEYLRIDTVSKYF